MMVAYWRVTEVRVIEGHAVWVRFADGLEGVVRFPPDFFQGVFSHLCAPEKFREVSVVDGAVTWPGGLDIAPDAMYDEVKLQAGQSLAGTLSADFPDDISDDDLGVDAPRLEMDW
jgi:hypothetical protein